MKLHFEKLWPTSLKMQLEFGWTLNLPSYSYLKDSEIENPTQVSLAQHIRGQVQIGASSNGQWCNPCT